MSRRRWFVLFALLVIPFVLGFIFLRAIPDVDILAARYPKVRYQAREDGGTHVTVTFQSTRPQSWTALSSIPSWVQGAVITSEDWAFFQHDGFDFNQIREAVEEKTKSRGRAKKLRGASTLSQQLVKNLFLSQDRSWVRKAREAWLTHRLESHFSKKKILEFYLNVVEWGRDVVGIRQAAQHYFGKSPSALNPREAAYLAYLLPSPVRYSRGFYRGQVSAFAHYQIQRNLDRMKQAGYVTDVQLDFFSRQRLAFEVGSFPPESEDTEELLEGTEETAPDSEPPVVSPESVDEEAPADVDSPSSL
jgi:monofunctional biosynthetic peptidoglycan transglycosylase